MSIIRPIWILALATSCTPIGPAESDCTALKTDTDIDATPDLTVTRRPNEDSWVGANVTLEGTVEADVGVLYVAVDGAPLERKVFNFERWTATLDIAWLRARAQEQFDAANPYSVDVVVSTETVCETTDEAVVSFLVKPTDAIPVQELATRVTPPAWCYLPIDRSAAALVDVCAKARSAGGSVSIVPSGVSVEGAATSVQLSPFQDDACGGTTGTPTAGGRFVLRGTTASVGHALISASGSEPETLDFDVSGPPVLSATATTLVGTQTTETILTTDGMLDRCIFSAAQLSSFDIQVGFVGQTPTTVTGAILSFNPPPPACDAFVADDARVLRVRATNVSAADLLTVQCEDVYGQPVTGKFTIPAPP